MAAGGAASGDVPALPVPPRAISGVRRGGVGVGYDAVHGVRARLQQLVVAVVIIVWLWYGFIIRRAPACLPALRRVSAWDGSHTVLQLCVLPIQLFSF